MKLKIESNKKGGSSKNWIQKAVNPKHKGYCTPMSKPTCTPRRKALAKRFKAMAKHENGGSLEFVKNLCEKYKSGGQLSLKKHENGGTIDLSKILSIWKK